MKLRRIRAGEGPALREIRLRALAESPSAFGSTLAREQAFDEALWANRAEESSRGSVATTFVVEDARGSWQGLVTVLGPTHEAADDPTCATLVSMWIAPEARRQGLAKKLVQAAVEFATSIGAPTLRLAVTRSSTAARQLYETFGFEPAREESYEESHPCHGEIQMTLPLSSL
jgi:ribosomal protein S18 acetylase RimI-like enzyme